MSSSFMPVMPDRLIMHQMLFPVGSSPFSSHTTVSSSLRRGLRISMMFFHVLSLLLVYSHLGFDLFIHLPAVWFFLELSSLFLSLCHAAFQEKNQHIVYRVPDIDLFPPDCPGRATETLFLCLGWHLSQDIVISPHAHPFLGLTSCSVHPWLHQPLIPWHVSTLLLLVTQPVPLLSLPLCFLFDPLLLNSSRLSSLCDIDFFWWVGHSTRLHTPLDWWLHTFPLLLSLVLPRMPLE